MGKHYCRQGGVRVARDAWPLFADPGRVVENTDRPTWEEPVYGRVRMVFRCCGTALVECMDDQSPECVTTHTVAVAVTLLRPVPVGVSYRVPCLGAPWSASLDCGHVNGEGCDCDTVAVEAGRDVDDTAEPVHEVIGCTRDGMVSAHVADDMIASYENSACDRNRYEVRRSWDAVSYTVAVAVRGRVLPFLSYMVPLL